MLTARVPQKITVLLTHRCNQRCEFCFDASNVLCSSERPDLDLGLLDQVLGELAGSVGNKEQFNVTLSGGEPTLHREFLEVVRRVHEAGFPVTVLSNGQRFADAAFMDEVLKYRIWNFQFSIEGSSPETHDARVGVPGAWAKTVRAIRNALERGVRTVTNTTMTPESVADMFPLVDVLADVGVQKMNIGNTLPECVGRNHSLLFEYPVVVDIAEKLTLYALTRRIGFSFITPLPACLKDGRVISNPSVCSAGAYSLTIDTDGSLLPCSVCNVRGPSVCEGGYAGAYVPVQALVRQRVTDSVPQECRGCPRYAECKAACPLYWKVDGVAAPSAWLADRDLRRSVPASGNSPA